MKDYKRLTISGGHLGFYSEVVNKCSNKDRPDIRKQLAEGKKSYEIEGYECQVYTSEELSNIYKRLGELEDKIEDGTLVEWKHKKECLEEINKLNTQLFEISQKIEQGLLVELQCGEMVEIGNWAGSIEYQCTACEETMFHSQYYRYCPYCGAKMRDTSEE